MKQLLILHAEFAKLRPGRINTPGCIGLLGALLATGSSEPLQSTRALLLEAMLGHVQACPQRISAQHACPNKVMPYWFWSVKKLFESAGLGGAKRIAMPSDVIHMCLFAAANVPDAQAARTPAGPWLASRKKPSHPAVRSRVNR